MTNEEKYEALVEFTKKYGTRSGFFDGAYVDICFNANIDYRPEEEPPLTIGGLDFYGYGHDDYLMITPRNIDEGISFIRTRLNFAKKFLDLLEKLDD